MSAKPTKNDEDDNKPRNFELIEVFWKGEDKAELEPIGILYRDPRVDEDGGFVAKRGYLVDFKSTAEGDKITLMTAGNGHRVTAATITRENGTGKYESDQDHDVSWNLLEIDCSKKAPNETRRNSRGRRGGGRSRGGFNSNDA